MREFKVKKNHLFIAFLHDGKAFVKAYKYKNLRNDKTTIMKFYKRIGFALEHCIEALLKEGE